MPHAQTELLQKEQHAGKEDWHLAYAQSPGSDNCGGGSSGGASGSGGGGSCGRGDGSGGGSSRPTATAVRERCTNPSCRLLQHSIGDSAAAASGHGCAECKRAGGHSDNYECTPYLPAWAWKQQSETPQLPLHPLDLVVMASDSPPVGVDAEVWAALPASVRAELRADCQSAGAGLPPLLATPSQSLDSVIARLDDRSIPLEEVLLEQPRAGGGADTDGGGPGGPSLQLVGGLDLDQLLASNILPPLELPDGASNATGADDDDKDLAAAIEASLTESATGAPAGPSTAGRESLGQELLLQEAVRRSLEEPAPKRARLLLGLGPRNLSVRSKTLFWNRFS